MPYKDIEAKRRYMERYYKEKIKPGEIPCTKWRKGLTGLTSAHANKTPPQTPSKPAISSPVSPVLRPIKPIPQPQVTVIPQRAPAVNPTRTGLNLFSSFREKPTRMRATCDVLKAPDIPTATRIHITNLRQSGVTVDDTGNSMRWIKPGEN